MVRKPEALGRERFDLFVIGGGIVATAIARDAALRGLKVALAAREDFAAGASGRTSKLAHGGLRYLEHGQVGLVRESCRERERMVRAAPHLVRPLAFLLPFANPEEEDPLLREREIVGEIVLPKRSLAG